MLKLSRKSHLKAVFNNRGVSIIEVLVAAGLASIVSLGIATMVQNMSIEQKKTVLLSTLKDLKNRIEYLARDPNSWSQTVNVSTGTNNSNANTFGAIRNQAALNIAGLTFTTPEKLILFDASGAIAMNLLGPTDATGNGFTEAGASCTTFNAAAGAGDDACPLSYRLLIGYQCTGAATTCTNPQIRIVGRLVFNPSTTGILNRYRILIAQIAGADISSTAATALGKYDAIVERTPTQGNRSFVIAVQFNSTSATANCTNNGVGLCSVGAAAVHPRSSTSGWTAVVPSSLVTSSGANFRFTESGAYACNITVPAFATGGFYAELYNATTATSVASATTTAGLWTQASAIIDTKFNISETAVSTPHQFQIRQRCDAIPTAGPSGDANIGNCTLGAISSGSYNGTSNIITVSCYKFDSSF